MLDPDLQEIERKWKASGLPGLYSNADGPEARRRAIVARRDFYPKPHIAVGSAVDTTVPGPAGPIPVRVVRPKSGEATATVVYFHGGGWIVGDLDSHEAHAARIANETGSVVVNVDYRLAPEHPFPAAIDDALAATVWVHDHIAEFGGDASRLAVAGDSAGGNLAAVVAIECRDLGIPLAAQLLLYPATDLTLKPDPDIVGKYLGPDYLAVAASPRVSPAKAATLKGVAPTILGVGSYDYLYDDNMAYAALLKRDGVRLILREYPTLNHGFFSYTAISEISLRAAQQICGDLRMLLHGAP